MLSKTALKIHSVRCLEISNEFCDLLISLFVSRVQSAPALLLKMQSRQHSDAISLSNYTAATSSEHDFD